MIHPLKAVRYPWFKHHIATALLDAFPWLNAPAHPEQKPPS
jgi:hypothetical protein